MKLQSFQIQNCFGFRDSGKVNLEDDHNFIYILGRNSSGKSSFLNSIKYFESGIVPKDQPNFRNFNDSGEGEWLIAEFSIEKSDLSVDRLIKHFYAKYKKDGIDERVVKTHPKLSVLLEKIKGIYQDFISELVANERARIAKGSSGHYLFTATSTFDTLKPREQEVVKAIDNARESNNNFLYDGGYHQVNISFNEIEDLLFLQFPRIIIFNERYSLKESLPERITSETLRTNSSKFITAFLSYLGEEKVKRFLQSDDPDEIEEIKIQLQNKVNDLTTKVNSHRGISGNKDLLEIRLHEKNGLQITIQTDGKKSYYTHISDNTKFLFAYYLYHAEENISGDILLFDEPSNGFHPTAQDFILNFLRTLSSNNNLVIIATHSEYLIDLNLLSGVRLMSVDGKKNIVVKNYFYNQPKEKGDYLALQPIFDAIGFNYGKQINFKDKVIITEGITDMLQLRAFNIILGLNFELNIAPARSDSHILSLIPLLISQGISFKIVIDTGDIKAEVKRAYGVDDKFMWEVPIPSEFAGKMRGSGIEDLFTKDDFKKLLIELGETVDASFENVSNSFYIRNKVAKRLIAHHLYEKANSIDASVFEPQTIENFRKVLEFCNEDKWFNI